jgi:hypothetical protein
MKFWHDQVEAYERECVAYEAYPLPSGGPMHPGTILSIIGCMVILAICVIVL